MILSELSLVSTDALKTELQKRYDAGIIMMTKDRDREHAEIDYKIWGNTFTVLGLAQAITTDIEIQSAELLGSIEGESEEEK